MRFLTWDDQKRITILEYTKYVHKLNLTIKTNLSAKGWLDGCLKDKFMFSPVHVGPWEREFRSLACIVIMKQRP